MHGMRHIRSVKAIKVRVNYLVWFCVWKILERNIQDTTGKELRMIKNENLWVPRAERL